MTIERQIAFWVAALVVFIAALWLLSPVMLPFVAGIVLAYLLNPLARRLERLGVARAVAGLVIIVLALAALIVLVLLLAPILVGQLSAFIDRLPGYVTRLQSLIADPGHEWLTKILGERLPDASKSVGELMSQGAGWLAAVPALAVVGRTGAGVDPVAHGGDAGGRLLSAVRLGPHDRDDRRLGTAAATGNRAGARARDRRGDRRLRARADQRLPDLGRVLCRGLGADRAQFRFPDRVHGGAAQLHSLRRLAHRSRRCGRRRHRPVLAELDADHRHCS